MQYGWGGWGNCNNHDKNGDKKTKWYCVKAKKIRIEFLGQPRGRERSNASHVLDEARLPWCATQATSQMTAMLGFLAFAGVDQPVSASLFPKLAIVPNLTFAIASGRLNAAFPFVDSCLVQSFRSHLFLLHGLLLPEAASRFLHFPNPGRMRVASAFCAERPNPLSASGKLLNEPLTDSQRGDPLFHGCWDSADGHASQFLTCSSCVLACSGSRMGEQALPMLGSGFPGLLFALLVQVTASTPMDRMMARSF